MEKRGDVPLKLSTKKSKILALIIILCISTLIQGIFLGIIANEKRSNKEHDARFYGQNVASSIQLTIENSVETTESLKYIYKQYGDSCFTYFDNIAENMIKDHPTIASMYIAPDGVIQAAYPDSVKSSTIGFDMLHDEAQGPRAQLAKDSKKVTIAGPHNLVEGGVGLIIRNPIYDGDTFLGFSIIVLDWDKCVDQILQNLESSNTTYKYAVKKKEYDSTAAMDEDGYLFRNTQESISNAVSITFSVPNDTWVLYIEPVEGFFVVKQMVIDIILSVVISLCIISFIVFSFLYNEKRKDLEKEQAENEAKTLYMDDLAKALEKAKKAEIAKTNFLSKMSHDIRTPLNGIIGLIEIGENHSDDKALIDENRQKAKVAANHLLSLISDVLELSKLDDDNVTLSNEAFNILEMARDVITITELRAKENGITVIHPNCAESIKKPYVYGSPLHLRQVLINILGNAIKYNKKNGSITCSMSMISSTKSTVIYQAIVSDTGIGMSKEFMEQMYEPFTQEHSDARSVYQGTGLGMAITKSIVDKMKGKIECESEVGVGTTFKITIPFKIANKEDIIETKSTEEVAIKNLRILLVEDNELNMEIAKTLLSDAGASITTANNGQEAVDIFKNNPPGTFDVILMDIMMPIMDGLTATKEIRKLNRSDAQEIMIYAMTANAFAEDVKTCLDAGMNGHLSKPIEIHKIIEVLSKINK